MKCTRFVLRHLVAAAGIVGDVGLIDLSIFGGFRHLQTLALAIDHHNHHSSRQLTKDHGIFTVILPSGKFCSKGSSRIPPQFKQTHVPCILLCPELPKISCISNKGQQSSTSITPTDLKGELILVNPDSAIAKILPYLATL